MYIDIGILVDFLGIQFLEVESLGQRACAFLTLAGGTWLHCSPRSLRWSTLGPQCIRDPVSPPTTLDVTKRLRICHNT